MTKKKLTEKEIDEAIKKAEKDIPHKVIKSEKKDTTQVCPICKGKRVSDFLCK